MQKTIFYFQVQNIQVICHLPVSSKPSETKPDSNCMVIITVYKFIFTGKILRIEITGLIRQLPDSKAKIRQSKLEGCYA